jgi:MIP family channel proteins
MANKKDDAEVKRLNRKPSFREVSYATFVKGGVIPDWRIEIQSRRFIVACVSEFLATLVLVLCITLSVMTGQGDENFESINALARRLQISFSIGFITAALVFATGNTSGANLNPAVTLSLLIVRKISVLRAACYTGAQVIGAILGAVFAYSMSPGLFVDADGAANLLSTDPRINAYTAISGEILFTGVLVFVVHAASDAAKVKSSKYLGATTPIIIGFVVVLANLVMTPIDGCSMNPAKALGSAVALGTNAIAAKAWSDLYIQFVGPLCGAVISALLYKFVFQDNDVENRIDAYNANTGVINNYGVPSELQVGDRNVSWVSTASNNQGEASDTSPLSSRHNSATSSYLQQQLYNSTRNSPLLHSTGNQASFSPNLGAISLGGSNNGKVSMTPLSANAIRERMHAHPLLSASSSITSAVLPKIAEPLPSAPPPSRPVHKPAMTVVPTDMAQEISAEPIEFTHPISSSENVSQNPAFGRE